MNSWIIESLFQIRHVSIRTVRRHTSNFIYPHIVNQWNKKQEDILANLPEKIVVQGDGRSDSPGHCAK